MFYVVPTASVIFTAKTSLDVFSLRRVEVFFSVFGNRICEMKKMTESGQQERITCVHICCTLTLGEPNTNWESNPKDCLLSAGSPIVAL